MSIRAHTIPQPSEKRLVQALAACGIAAVAALVPAHAPAAGPTPGVIAVETGGPMARPGAADGFDGAGITPRTWVTSGDKAGSGGIPAILTPYAAVSPGSLTFTVPLGAYSLPQRITLTNTSGFSTGVFPNLFGGNFTYVTNCPTGYPGPDLADGSSCYFDIDYRPVGFGTDSTTLSINCCMTSLSIPLTGQAVRGQLPFLEASPSSLSFPTTEVGDASEPLFIDVRNLSVIPVDISFSATGDFAALESLPSIPAPDGAPQSMAKAAIAKVYSSCGFYLYPSQTCQVGVVFAPTLGGLRTGAVFISTGISQLPLRIPLLGNARVAGAVSTLSIPSGIDFGRVPVGEASPPRPFNVRNNTASEVTISEFTVTGDFQVEKGTCDTIPAASDCTANLVFKPQALGPRDGSVVVKTPSDPLPYSATLEGTGIPNPNPILTFSALQLGFGNGLLGAAASMPVTATNSGQVPVNISRIYAVGDYLPTHTCPAVLAPGESCVIEVGFSARLRGQRLGTLVVESNAVGSPHSIELSGTGCSFSAATLRGRSLLCGS